MGNLESAINPAQLKKTVLVRQSSNSSPKHSDKLVRILRRQSSLASYFCSKNDSSLPMQSPGRLKHALAMRSHSEQRLALQPNIQISGDLNSSQNNAIRKLWKQEMKKCNDNEFELASRLLLCIFALDERLQIPFYLSSIAHAELRKNEQFKAHVKVTVPTLTFIMSHLHDPTAMSKSLQALGARHVIHTKVQYRSNYWKVNISFHLIITQNIFLYITITKHISNFCDIIEKFLQVVNQAFMQFVNADQSSTEVFHAWNVLGNFCIEQMRIGYRIEFKAQKVIRCLKKQGSHC
ncbi:unnamed protein product [Thelazia callipaeda]|uniref:GLOBIN domain-containing protein n=1 Tax=Thelazia callipaeda TaxID=103827 RepID=A0A0N5CZN6_THECL|nr:unnamed protein product [Thelazia callipaeda]